MNVHVIFYRQEFALGCGAGVSAALDGGSWESHMVRGRCQSLILKKKKKRKVDIVLALKHG